MRILIVEDDQDLCQELKLLLDNAGYDGMILKDFEHAKEEILALCPDLVLLDITMPHMSGIEVLKKLKEIDAEVKIVMCSAVGQESIIREAVIEGAIDFIVKPFKEDVLKRTVCAIVYADKGV